MSLNDTKAHLLELLGDDENHVIALSGKWGTGKSASMIGRTELPRMSSGSPWPYENCERDSASSPTYPTRPPLGAWPA